jgi:hypothetical protein
MRGDQVKKTISSNFHELKEKKKSREGAHSRGGQIIRLLTAYRTAIDRLPT